jgi:hypothetical protein
MWHRCVTQCVYSDIQNHVKYSHPPLHSIHTHNTRPNRSVTYGSVLARESHNSPPHSTVFNSTLSYYPPLEGLWPAWLGFSSCKAFWVKRNVRCLYRPRLAQATPAANRNTQRCLTSPSLLVVGETPFRFPRYSSARIQHYPRSDNIKCVTQYSPVCALQVMHRLPHIILIEHDKEF